MEKIKNYLKSTDVFKSIVTIIYYVIVFELYSKALINGFISFVGRDFISSHAVIIEVLFELVIYLLIFIPLILWNFPKKTEEFSIKKAIFGEEENSSKFLLSIFYGFIFFMFCNVISNIIIQMSGISTSQNQEDIVSMAKASKFSFFILFLVAGIIGPIVEELVYRKSVFGVCKNPYVGLLVSTFVFGIVHVLSTSGSFGYKLIVGVPYFISGLSFGLIYLKSGKNIAVSTAVHMISNIISLISILLL